jgi:tRNA 2-thiouridine synthesizing protein A
MLLDVRGEICPYPMKKAMEAMERLPEGEELEVLVDHPPAIDTIRMAARRFGFAMTVDAVTSGEWRIRLRRQAQEVRR